MSMIKIAENTFIPMPMSIVGTMLGGKENFMAVGWITRANARPPMLAACIGRSHATHDGIMETGAFSVNIPGPDLLVATDYVGIASGHSTDKSGVFDVFYGELPGAPLIKNAIACFECRLVQSVELPSNRVFIGEITGAWCQDSALSGKAPDYRSAGAFFLTMPDNRYWSFGEDLGKAWSAGKDYKK